MNLVMYLGILILDIGKCSNMIGFPTVFEIVIFKRLTIGVLEFLVHIL